MSVYWKSEKRTRASRNKNDRSSERQETILAATNKSVRHVELSDR